MTEQPAAEGGNRIRIGADKTDAPIMLDLQRLMLGSAIIQGTIGAGKSWLMRRILEQANGRVQQLVIDIEDEFATLAECFEYVVIDYAEAARIGGTALGTVIREKRFDVVLDLSDAEAEPRMQLVADLARSLVEQPRELWRPLLVAADELQQLAPHYDDGEVEKEIRKRVISSLADLMTRGRKRGLGAILATQRIAETSKTVTAKATTYLIGRTVFDRDLQRAAAHLGFTAGKARGLKKLEDGEFLALGPAIGNQLVRFKVARVTSKHGGQAPELDAPPATTADEARSAIAGLPSIERDTESRPAEVQEPHRGPPRKVWSAAEDQILADVIGSGGSIMDARKALHAAGFEDRVASAISNQCKILGVLNLRRSAAFHPKEEAIIRAGVAAGRKYADIARDLATEGFERTWAAVQLRVIKLGLSDPSRVRALSPREVEIIKTGLESGRRHSDIMADCRAEGFERGHAAIDKVVKRFQLQRPRENPWTDEHVAILRARYGDGVSPKLVAAELNRPYSAIVGKASLLGISMNRAWPIDDQRKLADGHAAGKRLIDVVAEIGRPYPNVARMAHQMGLDFSLPQRSSIPSPAPAASRKPSHANGHGKAIGGRNASPRRVTAH